MVIHQRAVVAAISTCAASVPYMQPIESTEYLSILNHNMYANYVIIFTWCELFTYGLSPQVETKIFLLTIGRGSVRGGRG